MKVFSQYCAGCMWKIKHGMEVDPLKCEFCMDGCKEE